MADTEDRIKIECAIAPKADHVALKCADDGVAILSRESGRLMSYNLISVDDTRRLHAWLGAYLDRIDTGEQC